jgi:flagellar FliL protein
MNKKMMLIIGGVVVLFFTIFGAGFFILWTKMATAMTQPNATAEGAATEAAEEVKPLYRLDTIIVNLADEGGKRYLRTTLQLELENEALKAEIDKRLPHIRNAILMSLPEKTFAEVSTLAGKSGVRDEIIEKVNGMLTTGQITNLYYTEFVVQ